MKVKNTPTTSNNEKFHIAEELNKPYAINGNPKPKIKLIDKEIATPRYCPINIEERFSGCAKSNSVNSLEL